MTRQTHLGVPFGCLLLLLLCAQPCLATQCADLGLVCSGTPPPPPADCLADGTAWTYNAIAECCSGYAFGAYCGCLPVGEPVQGTAAECCSRNSDGGSPDLCTAPCVQKNGVCEPCVGRRRSLQGMMELQCNCCTNLLCILNTTSTPVCASNPSPPGIGEITATSSGSGKYTIEVTLIASNDTGAVGIDMQIYILSADIVGVGYSWTEYVSPGPSLKATRSDQLCGTSYVFSASCQNTAFVQSSSVTKSYSLPAC